MTRSGESLASAQSKPSALPVAMLDCEMNRYVYRGSSMRGTLRAGDRVLVQNLDFDSIYSGDVVVFRNRSSLKCETIHRVREVRSDGLLTQGDNCPCPDKDLVTEDSFLGIVKTIERNGRQKRISGAARGLLRAHLLALYWRVRTWFSPVSRPSYLLLGKTVIMMLKWRPRVARLQIAAPSGRIIKYVHAGRTVARWVPATGEWECRKPYDLILPDPRKS